MSLHASRLKWIRESLRRPDGQPVDKRALSRALGWPEARWKNLESELPWGDGSREAVRVGLPALVARTTLPEAAGQAAAAFVLGETTKKPWSSPPTWREGQCPVAKQVGRPKGTGRAAAEEEQLGRVTRLEQAAHPMPPETLRRAMIGEVLRAVASGEVDQEAAIDTISGLYEPLRRYYHEEQSDPAA